MMKNKMRFNSITEKDIQEIKKNPRNFSRLLNDNKDFINKIIHKVNKNKNEDYEYFLDSFQEGSIGLWNAVETYSGKKSSFSTYAYTCIKNAILQNVQSIDKKKNQEVSIEKFLKNLESDDSEYYENKFIDKKKDQYKEIDEKIDREILLSKMNNIDKIIYTSRISGLSLKETSKKTNMNWSTFKVYYYKVFLKKMKELMNYDRNL